MGDVVLTGATGFLGGFVAAELVRQTEATVHCVVRGHTATGAARRLEDHLGGRRLARRDRERLVIVHGDLRQPRLGLPDAEYERLAAETDAVYHCAASVNLAADYEWLAPTNVGGTRAVIELAAHRRSKTIHHVSSLGVFVAARRAGLPEVDESTIPQRATTGDIGYCRTKLDAETLIREAGLPAAIYRPGIILGDSRTGTCTDFDVTVRALRAAVAVGVAPRTTSQLWVGAVDHVARTMVALSRQPDAADHIYHLVNPRPLAFRQAFDRACDLGYRLTQQPVPRWRATLAGNMANPDAFAMLTLWRAGAYLLEETPDHRLPRIRCDATSQVLSKLGLAHPPVDEAFLDRMIDYLVARGRLPLAGTESATSLLAP